MFDDDVQLDKEDSLDKSGRQRYSLFIAKTVSSKIFIFSNMNNIFI